MMTLAEYLTVAADNCVNNGDIDIAVLMRQAACTIARQEAQLAERERAFKRLGQENLERAEAVIMQAANVRNLADALKSLTQAARISGGVAGADSGLMEACQKAENALSFVGVGMAVNAVLDVLDEQGRLRKQLAEAQLEVDRRHGIGVELRNARHERDEALEKLAASEARATSARDLLISAVNDIEEWAGYASEYFQNKHQLRAQLDQYRSAIAALPQPREREAAVVYSEIVAYEAECRKLVGKLDASKARVWEAESLLRECLMELTEMRDSIGYRPDTISLIARLEKALATAPNDCGGAT